MSSVYADRKLAEALAQAGGSSGAARRLMLEWIDRDDRLLRDLVAPFLTGIVSHAVDKAARAPKPKKTEIVAQAHQMTGTVLDSLVKTLGKNFAAAPGPLGIPAASPARVAVSPRHADTIRSLAKAHISGRANFG